jgi:uncharacterized iron-regulated membrane protein
MSSDPTTASVKPRKPFLSRVPADFVRAVLKGHSSLGLAFAAAIYLVCLTGSIVVFAHEFERWELAGSPRVEHASPQAVQRALTEAVRQAGEGVEHGYIQMPSPALPQMVVSIDTHDGPDITWIADANGKLATRGDRPLTEFLTRLHINLHLPQSWGVFLVGMTGVTLLSSLISGILAHPRILRDAFHLRIGGSKRLQEADLHNRLGVWALPFHVIVSLTGALLGLTTLIVGVLGLALFQGDVNKVYALFIPQEPKEDARPAPVIDLVPMFADLSRRVPGGRIDLVMLEHPTEMGGAALFNVEHDDGRLANTDAFAFDRVGKLYYAKHAADNNLGESILASMGKLHFGWFGGGIIKVAYSALGLGLTYLAASGVNIWLARRRDKRNPAPGWERVWASVVWGQPAALAVASVVGIVLSPTVPVGALIVTWAGFGLLALATSAILEAPLISRIFKLLAAASLICCALAHAVIRPSDDPVAWAIDITLLALGAGMGWTAIASTRASLHALRA